MDTRKPIAALFDFDGVVMDTESQYSKFWKEMGKKYHPETENFELCVKGQTLKLIYDKYFAGMTTEQETITEALNRFEEEMVYEYVPGVEEFINDLQAHGVKTAVVTSSNNEKMEKVYRVHPELKTTFDKILTAEYFSKSKPDPDCYLLGAKVFDTVTDNCFVFEDSFNGLESGRRAEMTVIGLSTTNPRASIVDKADLVIPDFEGFTFARMMEIKK